MITNARRKVQIQARSFLVASLLGCGLGALIPLEEYTPSRNFLDSASMSDGATTDPYAALKFMENLSLNRAKFEFLKDSSPDVFDLLQDPLKSGVSLDARFLRESPMDAALILHHEAWHLRPDCPSHVVCRNRDMSSVQNLCDDSFKLGPAMGAYSLQVMVAFGWSIAAENISEAQREYLRTQALWLLMSRHNDVPSSYFFTL